MQTEGLTLYSVYADARHLPKPAGRRTLLQMLRDWFSPSVGATREHYLAGATDHADVECRMRQWAEKERRDAAMYAARFW